MKEINRDNIENDVLSWYQEYWGVPIFPFFKKITVTEDSSLSTGKWVLPWEDAEDLLVEYFEKFQVEQRNFSFMKYWPNEEIFMPLNFLRRKGNKYKYIEPAPLTVQMLMKSAKAGHWLYD